MIDWREEVQLLASHPFSRPEKKLNFWLGSYKETGKWLKSQ